MKKIKNKKYADFIAKKRFAHDLKRKPKKYIPYFSDGLHPNKELSRFSAKYSRPTKAHKIDLPPVFSLVENMTETIQIFNKILEYVEQHKPVFVNSRDVEKMTPDAILYFILLLEEIHAKYDDYSISGNSPKNDHCKKLFLESGFMNYVRSPAIGYKKDTDIFTIREGIKADPIIAKDVLKYVKKHLGIENATSVTRAIYAAIIEAMANTYNHAVKKGSDDIKKWYLMAHYTDDGDVHFVFLDSGIGIPRTIRRDFKEIVQNLFVKPFVVVEGIKDDMLIMSAFEGKFRTQTKEKKRGKGLPKMYELANEGHLKGLTVISNKGFVNPTDGITHSLPKKFHGTLLSWKVTRKKIA